MPSDQILPLPLLPCHYFTPSSATTELQDVLCEPQKWRMCSEGRKQELVGSTLLQGQLPRLDLGTGDPAVYVVPLLGHFAHILVMIAFCLLVPTSHPSHCASPTLTSIVPLLTFFVAFYNQGPLAIISYPLTPNTVGHGHLITPHPGSETSFTIPSFLLLRKRNAFPSFRASATTGDVVLLNDSQRFYRYKL